MKPLEINPAEYNPYYKVYLDLVDNIELVEALQKGLDVTVAFFENLPKEKWEYRYDLGKWTPKDILLHIIDTERVFCYRALYFARSNNADLKGFDENIFAADANANARTKNSLIEEYKAVRATSILLFNNFDTTVMLRKGTADGSLMSVRAAGYILCGHEIHHCSVIKERYLK